MIDRWPVEFVRRRPPVVIGGDLSKDTNKWAKKENSETDGKNFEEGTETIETRENQEDFEEIVKGDN